MASLQSAASIDVAPSVTSLPASLHDIVAFSFEEAHGFKPHEWQTNCIAQVIDGSSRYGVNAPCPSLICRSTGGGKSACRNTIGFMEGGVILTIVPLLSLGADQTDKLQSLTDANKLPVEVYHLDQYQSDEKNRSLREQLNQFEDNSDTLFLFSSPQKLLSKEWAACFGELIKKEGVNFTLCIDECHLYAHSGTEFRSEFHAMKSILFDPIARYRPAMPILFLTATSSKTMLADLEKLTGLVFLRANLLWSPSPSSVARRQVCFNVVPRESPLGPLKADIRRHYGMTSKSGDVPVPKDKLIFYSNSKRRLIRYHELITSFLDEEEYAIDLVAVHGDLFREQKFHNIETFCSTNDLTMVDETSGKTISFVPRVLFATAGVANAGLDDPFVRTVHRDGYPATLEDLIQEAGRVARYAGALPSDNQYRLNISWKSLTSLFYRIFLLPILKAEQAKKEREEAAQKEAEINGPSTDNNIADPLQVSASTTNHSPLGASVLCTGEALMSRQYNNLLPVLRVIHLFPGCFHDKLEHLSVNPFVSTCHRPNPCRNACFFCLNTPSSNAIYKPASRSGLTQLLVDVFIKNPGSVESRLVDKNISNTLSKYVNVDTKATFNKMVFNSDNKTVKVQDVQLVLARLFAARILEPQLLGKQLCCTLTTDSFGNPNVNDDRFWYGIPLLDD